jgi:hypothetical protein
LLGENGTDVYNESGRLAVRNINPKVAGEVFLNALERTQVRPNLAPATPQPFQMQDLVPMDQQLDSDGNPSSGGGGSGGSSGGGNTPPSGSFGGSGFVGASGVPTNGSTPQSFFSPPSSGSSLPFPTASEIKLWTGGSGWWDDSGVPSGTSNWTSAGAPLNGNSAFLTQTDSIDRTVSYNYTAPVQLNELRIDATGSGNMTLRQDSSSSLAADNEYVGYQGRGIFLQSSGRDIATYGLYLGENPGSSGNYELRGNGQVEAENLYVGHSGSGTFTQSGGVNTVTNRLVIADNPGSSGIYNLQDGNLSAGVIRVNSGGVFNQTGGTLESGGLDNRGAVNLSGGTTTVTGNTSNQGTVRVSNTFVTWAGTFLNTGAYISDPATQSFTDLTITPTGYLVSGAGDRWKISNDFINCSVMNLSWDTLAAALIFTSGTDTAHSLYITGADYGSLRSGYTNNFAWGLLDLTGQSLTLYDGNDQAGGALYVGEIILGYTPEGRLLTVITGNGLNIYYDPELNPYLGGLTYDLMNGGHLMPLANPVPVPASAWLLISGLAVLEMKRLRRSKRDWPAQRGGSSRTSPWSCQRLWMSWRRS